MPDRRAILLCGSARPLLMATARELASLEARLVIQCGPDEVAAGERLSRQLARTAAEAAIVGVRLGGQRDAHRLVAQAWRRAPAIDTVVICVQPPVAAQAARPSLGQWSAGIGVGLRQPFFIAQQVGERLQAGGRVVMMLTAPAPGSGPLPHIAFEGSWCMVEALAKALPRRVALSAVIGSPKPTVIGLVAMGRGARYFAELDVVHRGAILDLRGPHPRG